MDVGPLLRRCRDQAGLSQQSLADTAGTSQPTVAAYESGRVTPSVPTLDRLLAACGHTMSVALAPEPLRWTRVEEKSLAVHRLIAARLLQDSVPTLRKAQDNLAKLRSADRGNSTSWIDQWDDLLDRSTDEIVTAMLARTQRGIDLRQMTPFAGVLTDTERRKALRTVPRSNVA